MMKIGRFLQIALLITLAAGASPALSAFWEWSKTASNNANADPSINWAEGMSPSSVNDSARAMMARAAEYRDDISGALTLGGTSTAYTVTTNQGLDATPVTGQMLAFVPNVTNGIAPTLTADGGTAYPLQITAGTALPSGTIVAGTPYRASFNGTAWVLEAIYGNPYAVPLGGLLASTVGTAPNSNFILPAGQCISTTTYATYWVAMGSPASGSCAGGQFAVIDMRGKVPAALDNLNGTAANLMTSSSSGCGTAFTTVGAICSNGNQTRTISVAQLPAHTHANTLSDPGHSHVYQLAVAGGGGGASGTVWGAYSAASTNSATTGISINNASAGSGAGVPAIQPTIGVVYFLRVI